MSMLGKTLVFFGLVLVAIGIVFMLSDKITWIGRLPGDIHIQKKNFSFYFPLTTSILISIVLTLIFLLMGRR